MTKKPENHAENAVNQAINQAIGTTIRKIREHLDISPEELATKTNIPKEQLCNGELGKTAFNGFELWNIANTLQMPVQTFFSHIEFDIPNNIKDFLEVVRLENILVCMLHNCKVRNMGKFVERVEKATTDLGIRSDKAENPILKERSKIVDLLVKAIQASNMDVDELMIKLNTSHAEYEEQIKNGGFSLIEILEITEDLQERLLENKG